MICPIGQLLFICVNAENLSALKRCSQTTGFQLLISLTHAAAARRGEGDDLLTGEIIAFKKGIDDRGRNIPPDGEACENRVVTHHVVAQEYTSAERDDDI